MQREINTAIRLLGDPVLRRRAAEVTDFGDAGLRYEIEALKAALEAFRGEHGFGRGTAANQIGVEKRIIALNLGEGTFAAINPRIVWSSDESFTLWDDCMSFPDLLVKVRRSCGVRVEYRDEAGAHRRLDNLTRAESELLQHEIDHLDGILALDRAVSTADIIYRCEYSKNRDFYDARIG